MHNTYISDWDSRKLMNVKFLFYSGCCVSLVVGGFCVVTCRGFCVVTSRGFCVVTLLRVSGCYLLQALIATCRRPLNMREEKGCDWVLVVDLLLSLGIEGCLLVLSTPTSPMKGRRESYCDRIRGKIVVEKALATRTKRTHLICDRCIVQVRR